MQLSSVPNTGVNPHSRRAAALIGLGLSLLASYSQAELISSIDFGVENALRIVDNRSVPLPQPVARSQGSASSDQGALVSFEGTPLAFFSPDSQVDGSGGVGPAPAVRVRAEATGRDFRLGASLDFDRAQCTDPTCLVVNGTTGWDLKWNAIARTRSIDTLVIDVPGLDGLTGQFTLPIQVTGRIEIDTDYRAFLRAGTDFAFYSADENGVRRAAETFSFNDDFALGEAVDRTIDSTTNFVVPFVFGEAFTLTSLISANASVLAPTNFLDGLNRLIVNNDFFSTAHFDPFENFRVDLDSDGLFDQTLDVDSLSLSSLLGIDYLATIGDTGGDPGDSNPGDDNPGGDDPVMPPVSVPEPGTLWLTALGGLALLRMRRRLPSPDARAIVRPWQMDLMNKQPEK